MLLYISSAMTDYEHNNFDKFFEVEDILKNKGYDVINPAMISIKMINEKYFLNVDRKNFKDFYDYFNKISREEYLNEDVKELVKCDGIVMFGDWQKSKGATFELKVAKEIGKKIYTLMENW